METVVFAETMVKITTQHHGTFHKTAVHSLLLVYVQLFHLHEIFGETHCPFCSLTAQFVPPVMLLAYIMLLASVLSWNFVVGDAFPNTVSCPTAVYMCARTTPHPGTETFPWAWCAGIWWVKAYVAWNKVRSAVLSFVIHRMAFLFPSRLFVFCRYSFHTLAWLPCILNL